jgi:two-component sensor histidine kinase
MEFQSSTMRVFTVDDTPDDRALVRREVEALFPGCQVIEAGSRNEFEAGLAEDSFDLVVTDLELKWGNGREVLERSRTEWPNCPVVMFTDSGDETTAVELMKAGLDDYVVKSARQLPRLRVSLRLAVENARTRTALTERERQLAAALEHEQTIVRELHHRVKNNLQTISSLLQFRAMISGGEVARELEEVAGRMHALSAVQARIYETGALDRVDFAAALGDMAQEMAKIHADRGLKLRCEFEGSLELDVARAMPLSLLCYEAILNALKHAWPRERAGELTVTLQADVKPHRIVIRDDGQGFEKGEVARGMGSRLMARLGKEAGVELFTVSALGKGTSVELLLP